MEKKELMELMEEIQPEKLDGLTAENRADAVAKVVRELLQDIINSVSRTSAKRKY